MFKTKIIYMLLLIIFLLGCDKKEITKYVNQQNVVCVISEIVWEDSPNDPLFVSGKLISDPLPEFYYFRLNDYKFSSSENYNEHLGFTEFCLSDDEENTIDIGSFTNFEISSEFGLVSGFQSKPANIKNISINGEIVHDNLRPGVQINLNQEVFVSWEYGNEKPDFIRISGYYYEWNDGEGFHEMRISENIPNSQNSIQLFEQDEINNVYNYIELDIMPINGPFPDNDTNGNLDGAGSGFIYWVLTIPENWINISVNDSSKIEDNYNNYRKKIKELSDEIIGSFND